MSQFQFVSFEGPTDAAQDQKRLAVRAHVMRRFHQQRRTNRAIQLQQLLMQKKDTERRMPHKDSAVTVSGSRVELTPAIIEHGSYLKVRYNQTEVEKKEDHADKRPADHPVGQGRDGGLFYDDDFEFPVPKIGHQIMVSGLYTHTFINQHVVDIEACYSALSRTSTCSPFSTLWLPASMVHPMLFHSSLFVCLASFETLQQKPLSAESFSHREKALQLINASLCDAVQQTSDEIVAAITSLANFECIFGDIAALRYHLYGLMSLASLRGGFQYLGMGGLLTRLIWLYSWILDTFHPEGLSPGVVHICDESGPSDWGIPTLAEFITLTSSPTADRLSYHPLSRVICDTYRLFILEETSDIEDTWNFSSEFDESPSSTLPIPVLQKITECCRLANQVWSSRSHHMVSTNSTQLLQFLKGCLRDTALCQDWIPLPGVLLWCLLVGIHEAYGDDSLYPWFASQLLRFWAPLSLQRWRGLQRYLCGFGRAVRRNNQRVGINSFQLALANF